MNEAQQVKVVRLQVGEKEFSLDKLLFAVLASSLETSTGMEFETPPELEGEEEEDAAAS